MNFLSLVAGGQARLTTPFEVYVEVAALRDYWSALGDPSKYTVQTHETRNAVLISILDFLEVDTGLIEQADLFRTKSKTPKLWSPGRWNLRSIDGLSVIGIKNEVIETLKQIKWAFNAKPDFLIR